MRRGVLIGSGVVAGLVPAMLGLARWAAGPAPTGVELLEVEATADQATDLTIVTWNLHYGSGPTGGPGLAVSEATARGYLDEACRQLRTFKPDIAAIQELDRGARRSGGLDQLDHLARCVGLPFTAWVPTWRARWVPWPGLSPVAQLGGVTTGHAVLSRWPLSRAKRHGLPKPAAQPAWVRPYLAERALLELVVERPTGPLRVVAGHLEAFDDANRAEHIRRLAEVADTGTGPAVVLGDLNGPRGELDPVLGPSLRNAVPPVGYVSAPGSWNTWPADQPTVQLDHVYATSDLKLASVRVADPEPAPSDHRPLITTWR